jgi:hypothetical protein
VDADVPGDGEVVAAPPDELDVLVFDEPPHATSPQIIATDVTAARPLRTHNPQRPFVHPSLAPVTYSRRVKGE